MLFPESEFSSQNLLPENGEVFYFGKVFSEAESITFFDQLLTEINWQADEAVIFGKLIYTKRKVAWYADETFSYTYSNRTKSAIIFTDVLLKIKEIVEKNTNETYNACLLNLYHSGEEGMAWHSDYEKELKKHGSIASVTFGAERFFSFKSKKNQQLIKIFLENGSLLEMKGTTQENWLHRLAPTKKVLTPRINLTFRTIEKK